MKCFYHNDFDGHSSAAILAKFCSENSIVMSKDDFIEINYNKSIDFQNISINDQDVYVLDYSLKSHEWEHVLKHGRNTIWIDHHISAIEKFKYLDDKVDGIRQDGVAACELAWRYFYPNKYVPYSVQLLGDYDVFKHEYGNDTTWFQNGLKIWDTHPCSAIWEKIFSDDLTRDVIRDGQPITEYVKKDYEKIVRSHYFEIDFEGLNALVCNSHARRSSLFDSIYDESKHDIMIPFVSDGNVWIFSLYTTKDDIDCSKIAIKYGGGGHRKAAGFVSKTIPWESKD
jgi:oligoribonuclease NrnB/cAMP/cGMP phosphodiesterase (DHH superfamily)